MIEETNGAANRISALVSDNEFADLRDESGLPLSLCLSRAPHILNLIGDSCRSLDPQPPEDPPVVRERRTYEARVNCEALLLWYCRRDRDRQATEAGVELAST
ncbi:hypothetical protein [Rhizobium oryziradicis]|uniref:hypothetical protein n=1 Tax=Rhizobium oryziradicis TaxID=1867956 RepID=UPI001115427D|nr:hypothetical protein [Rhizobium oryziradicis]